MPIIVESDCTRVISVALERTLDRSPYLNIISDIKLLASLDRVCKFVKVDRSEVRASHCLANFTRTEHNTSVWLGSGPDVAIQELERELVVTPIS
jgi:hypothetical protein